MFAGGCTSALTVSPSPATKRSTTADGDVLAELRDQRDPYPSSRLRRRRPVPLARRDDREHAVGELAEVERSSRPAPSRSRRPRAYPSRSRRGRARCPRSSRGRRASSRPPMPFSRSSSRPRRDRRRVLEGALAVHRPRASQLAQLLDQGGRNVCHLSSPPLSSRAARRLLGCRLFFGVRFIGLGRSLVPRLLGVFRCFH